MMHIFKFNLLKFVKSRSRETYFMSKRSFKKASRYVITTIQCINVFVSTKHTQIRI